MIPVHVVLDLALALAHALALGVGVGHVHRRHGEDARLIQGREVARPGGGFAGVALALVGAAELDEPVHEGAGVERDHAAPAGEDLEGLAVLVAARGDGLVPEEIGVVGPGGVLGDLEEGVAGQGARDPGVVEDVAAVDPVHGAGLGGVL